MEGRRHHNVTLAILATLVVALVAIAVGSLWGYKGTVIVVEGEGFSNTLTQYDGVHLGIAVSLGDTEPTSPAGTGGGQRQAVHLPADASGDRPGRVDRHELTYP